MKIIKENYNCPGIYVIKNSINGKVYVRKLLELMIKI